MRLLLLALTACGAPAFQPVATPQPPPGLQLFVAEAEPGLRFPIVITGATPGARVVGLVSTVGTGSGTCAPGGSPCSALDQAVLLGVGRAGADGSLAFSPPVPPQLPPRALWIQAWSAVDGFTPVVQTRAVDRTGPDSDGDGLTDGRETQLGLDPQVPDSDGDGLVDGFDPLPTTPGPFDGPRADDVLVSDPTSTIADVEIDPLSDRVTWQTALGEELWVAALDPLTGALVPPDGKGQLVDTDLTNAFQVRNGPEWIVAGNRSEIVYGRLVNGAYSISRAWQTTNGVWRTQLVPGSEGTYFPYGTKLLGDPDPWYRFTWETPSGEKRNGARRYLDPSSEVRFDRTLPWARWLDAEKVILATEPVDGIQQIRAIDPLRQAERTLTTDPSFKFISRTLYAPEWGDDIALVVLRGPVSGIYTELGIYRYDGTTLQEVRSLPGPPAVPYLHAPEVFVWNDRSYVVFEARATPQPFDDGVGQIWVASLDDGAPSVWRRVCDGTLDRRRDPEAYVGGDRPWIYYSFRDTTIRTLRRCDADLP